MLGPSADPCCQFIFCSVTNLKSDKLIQQFWIRFYAGRVTFLIPGVIVRRIRSHNNPNAMALGFFNNLGKYLSFVIWLRAVEPKIGLCSSSAMSECLIHARYIQRPFGLDLKGD